MAAPRITVNDRELGVSDQFTRPGFINRIGVGGFRPSPGRGNGRRPRNGGQQAGNIVRGDNAPVNARARVLQDIRNAVQRNGGTANVRRTPRRG